MAFFTDLKSTWFVSNNQNGKWCDWNIYIYKLLDFVSVRKILLSKNDRRMRISFRFFKNSYDLSGGTHYAKVYIEIHVKDRLVYELFYFQFNDFIVVVIPTRNQTLLYSFTEIYLRDKLNSNGTAEYTRSTRK